MRHYGASIFQLTMKKISIYTLLFQTEGENYIFNTQSLAKVRISNELYNFIINSDFDKIDRKTLSVLEQKKIIVDENDKYSFFNEMAMKTNIANFDSSTITLYIMPTIGCNFACPYCFEGEKKKKSMNDETINNIIKFLNISSAKSLSLHWYGGEPLTRFDLMKKIYNKIVNETSLEIIDHNIITNGYLIDDDVIDFFRNTQLKNIQITLDGCKEIHNSKRFDSLTKEGSFDRIVSNICRLSKELPKTHVNVRINVDKNNFKDFVPLYAFLHNECDSNSNVFVYPAVIKNYNNVEENKCFTNKELFALYKYYKEHGCVVNYFPLANKHTCSLCNAFTYTIGPEGEYYKCPEDANNPNRVIGYINSKAILRSGLLFRYINEGSQFNRKNCRDCYCFPLCFGGCAKDYLRTKYLNNKANFCHPLKNKEFIKQAFLDEIHDSNCTKSKTNLSFDLY